MRAQTAAFQSEDKFTRSFEEIGKEAAISCPADCHDASGESGNDESDDQLPGTDPRSDGGAELHISHTHPAHQRQASKGRQPSAHAAETLCNSMPLMKPGRD